MQPDTIVIQVMQQGDKLQIGCNQQSLDKVVMLQVLTAATQNLLFQLAQERGPAKPGIVIARPMS